MLALMMAAALVPDPTLAFYASMPARYREQFDATATREHAAIAARRARESAHAEIWRRLPEGGAILCVVADDRPGLLSFISAALVVRTLDVVAAQVYTHVGPHGTEAVDLFWVRREEGTRAPVTPADASGIAEMLNAFVTRELTIESVTRQTGARPSPPPGASTRITFEETGADGLTVLTVETFDRPGLLLAMTRALSRAGVQIVASEALSHDGRVLDRFAIVELDGAALKSERRGILRVEMLSAIDAMARGEL